MTTPMSPHEAATLIAARAKIERPECWTRGATARNVDGQLVASRDSRAVCWCAVGAIWAVSSDALPLGVNGYSEPTEWLRATTDDAGARSIGEWNDGATHADVMRGFDRAIAACGSES